MLNGVRLCWCKLAVKRLCLFVLQPHFMGLSDASSIFFVLLLRHSSTNFPECCWAWRPLLFPITILDKHPTGLGPAVSFISPGQLTVTPLLTQESMSAKTLAAVGTRDFSDFVGPLTQFGGIWPPSLKSWKSFVSVYGDEIRDGTVANSKALTFPPGVHETIQRENEPLSSQMWTIISSNGSDLINGSSFVIWYDYVSLQVIEHEYHKCSLYQAWWAKGAKILLHKSPTYTAAITQYTL